MLYSQCRHILIIVYDFYIVFHVYSFNPCKGSFKCYVTQMGVGVSDFLEKKRYEGVMFNVISVTRGWVGVQFPEK